MNIAEFSVKRRITTAMVAMIIILFGIVTFFMMGLDLMPDLEFPNVTVVTQYPGVAAEDIEELVTKPIEEIVGTVQGVKSVNSYSSVGASNVMVEFEWGTNLDFVAQDIRENIGMIKRFLPEDIEEPMVVKFNPSMMPVIMYGVTGMENTEALREYIDDNVRPRIERSEGVAAAMVIGGQVREVNISIDRAKLDAYGIDPNQVMGAVRASNMNISAGFVSSGHTEYLIRTMGQYHSLQDIAETVVGNAQGVPVRVQDIARVEDTFKERRHHTRLDGKDAVILAVSKQSGANTLTVIKGVRKALEEMKGGFPHGLELHPVIDQGDIIERTVNQVTQSAVIGGLLAIGILWLFLRNWRPTFAITVAIPLSILASFIGMKALGYTFNIITLGGLALAVGMLVDNAVVVIENTFRLLEEGKSRMEAAIKGASQVGMAITSSTLTTVAVFLPMCLSNGMAGKLSRPLALTISAGLGASVFVAMTIVPMLASLLFKKETKREEYEKDSGENRFAGFRNAYEKALGWCLKRRVTVIALTVLILIISLAIVPFLGFEFMPQSDSGMAIMNVKLPVGTNLEETDRIVKTLEERFVPIPEKKVVMAMVGPSEQGRGGSFGATDVNEAMMMLRLKDKEDRKRTTDNIMEGIRKALPDMHGVVIEFMDMSGSMMGGGMSGETAPVVIKIFGTDLEKLRGLGDEVQKKISGVAGLRDVNTSLREGKPELQIIPDRDRASSMGLTPAEIGAAMRTVTLGQVATRLQSEGEEIDIRVRLDEKDRASIDNIRNIPIVSRLGFTTPVDNVANIKNATGPIRIARENRVRKVSVTANVTGRDVGGAVEEIKTKLKDLPLESGYFIEYGGTYKTMRESMRDLLLALIIAMILIYMIMAAQFESLAHPMVIMFAIPFQLIGVVLGLAVFGFSVSVPAFMGFILLAGVAVNNGIVMIDFINQLRRDEGIEKHQAIIKGASLRLRPILVTSLTTIFGMLPMALSRSQGSEMSAPMGTVVAFGLTSSMFLTLFVIPVLYSLVDRISFVTTKHIKKRVLGHENA